MFSSTTNTVGPCSQLSSSHNTPLQYLISHNESGFDNLLHRQNQLTITNPPKANESFLINMEVSRNSMMGIGDQQNSGPSCSNFPSRKKADHVKKDRERKVYTAQGVRERRVRLSTEIATHFFHLQDMLGFNKASKTIEWLLTKSKKDINDLEKNCGWANSTWPSTSTTCKLALSENDGDITEGVASNKSLHGRVVCEETKKIKVEKLEITRDQSRAKARERARERTNLKMCYKKLINDSKRFDVLDHDHSSMSLSQQYYYEACEKSGFCNVGYDQIEEFGSSYSFANDQSPQKNNTIEEARCPFLGD